MLKISKSGFGPWAKTVVEAADGRHVFKGSADVKTSEHSTCVTEKGLFSQHATCFLHDDASLATGPADGPLVGASKSIEVKAREGGTKRYGSGLTSVNRLERQGEDIVVTSRGLFGDREVDRMKADEVGSITSSDCSLCKSVNPLYSK
jgi:hypothetical protein